MYFSERANPATHNMPRTRIVIAPPSRQEWSARLAMWKGSSKRTSPLARKNVPRTGRCQWMWFFSAGRDAKLTIKLNDVMFEALHRSPATCLLRRQQAFDLRLVTAVPQNSYHQHGKDRKDDSKSAVSPSPIRRVKLLAGCGTCVGGDDIWRRSERISQTSVAQRRCVGGDDINAEDHAREANAVEHLSLRQRLLYNSQA